jgi:ubiquinone/menaquinone biosynthesis C-methylase UbiE
MMQQSKLDNYNSVRGASSYRSDYDRKLHRRYSDARERRIFARFFAHTGPVASALDLPCGFGRLLGLLRENAGRVVEADWSKTMLDLNRRDNSGLAAGFIRCTALHIPLRDRAVDTVVSVRLSHHLESIEDRERHMRELMRVADRHVIMTYFSFHSVKNTLRRLRAPFDGKRPKNTLRRSQVDAVAASCGFRSIDEARISRIASGHVFVLLSRS